MNGSTIRADVCVIGAGPAGITVARELVDAGLRTVLLETGDVDESPATRELLRGKAVGPIIKGHQTYLSDSRHFQVGGAGRAWGRGARVWCVPFSPIDFRRRDWVEHSGWPIDDAELKPYIGAAARAMGIGPFADPRPVARPTGAPSPDLVVHAYHYPVDSGVFRRDFHSLCAHDQFRVELGTTATSFSASDGHIHALKAARRDGQECWIEAADFVLAAGGIENARILMIQNDVGRGSVLTQSDALGRYFMEHFHVYAGTITFSEEAPWREYLTTTEDRAHHHSWMRILGIADEAQRRERLLNTSIQLTSEAHPDGVRSDDAQLTCGVMVRAEQAPDPLSRMVLDDELDSLGRRRALLQWNVRDENWSSIVRALSLAATELSEWHGGTIRLAIGHDRAWPWPPSDPTSSPFPTWGHHHMGTTRMHDDPALGVVDRDCRVHGTTNLFVAGSSIFPTGGFANPTFTIVALAIRLAAHIAAHR